MNIVKLGVSGDEGSFSEEAALLYAKKARLKVKLVYLIDMEGVLSALSKDEISLGIIPVINSKCGLVKPAFEAMGRHLFKLVDELALDIQHYLLAQPGVPLNKIKTVVSHPQGLMQCAYYLNHQLPNCMQIEWIDTAKAARDLSQGILPDNTAVIAPQRCSELYRLNVLAQNIQGHEINRTCFMIACAQG